MSAKTSKTKSTRKPRVPKTILETKPKKSDGKKPVGPLAAVAAVILLLASRLGGGGFGNGLSLLPGGQSAAGQPAAESGAVAGSSASETPEASETVKETLTETTVSEETTTGTLVNIIEVTVNEDGYLFENQKCSLEDIFKGVGEKDEIHYIVQRASKDDVDDLVDMAKEKGIKIVKED